MQLAPLVAPMIAIRVAWYTNRSIDVFIDNGL